MSDPRIRSIDVLRALTMLLMIWVNDFWTLSGIPGWLQHMPADVDALGFSDVIFPAFLFIVGLSIPYALDARRARGETAAGSLVHIAWRSLALLVMGFFMVNLESYDASTASLSKSCWQLLMILAFVLIWNVYPRRLHPALQRLLQLTGIVILGVLVFTYRGQAGAPGMQPHWWGILGLIGWSYLLCASASLYCGRSLAAVAVCWAFFALFNIAAFAGWLDFLAPVKHYVWIVGDASMPAMTMAGCFVASLYQARFSQSGFNSAKSGQFLLLMAVLGCLVLAAGFALRPAWGISKILATPAWTQICTGIGILSFGLCFWLADVLRLNLWPRILLPAGVATLTCYLVPYVAYPLLQWLPYSLPVALTTGLAGLVKSMLFAVCVIIATGGLNRLGIRLKI